ncbi:MAG: HlyD family efflux transporter periplasmic adaptor subunit, partial [Flavobacteriaceae bacterium]|nr:HlyD family efflux transporter periplasmic adaptor subunit [Flavobacteriaceae bacterium]
KAFNRILWVFSIIVLVFLFLPWTQNIRGIGSVTTLAPEQRPHDIQTVIPGKIEQWYVREGDIVKKGDTILRISEIKDDYFNPNLLENVGQQISAKSSSMESYLEKSKQLDDQIAALITEQRIKINQAENKLEQSKLKQLSDSIKVEAAEQAFKIADTQYKRFQNLYERGLKSLNELEQKRNQYAQAESTIIAARNELLSTKNEVLNAQAEMGRIKAEYADKIAKSTSEKFSALSAYYDGESTRNKLQNDLSNYQVRSGLYYITAPQDGFINKAISRGIGENIKEGASVVSITPANISLAVETYIEPVDYPLIEKGNKVRIWFDGWPTIIFSGWPEASYGTFGGVVVAKEKFISPNGKFRILVAPDPEDLNWPEQISVGSGAQTIALLDRVPIWFEIWRTLNGFPPNFYSLENESAQK